MTWCHTQLAADPTSGCCDRHNPNPCLLHRLARASLLQEVALPPDHDLITVSDVLLVMDQAGSGGNLTAGMLEIPATPDSRAELWAGAS